MQTDNKTLLDDVERAFELAVDPSIPLTEQITYDALGNKLRARLITLLTAKFDDGTIKVKEANLKIKEVNRLLKKRLVEIENAAKTIQALGDLVSIIDDLFNLPFTFV